MNEDVFPSDETGSVRALGARGDSAVGHPHDTGTPFDRMWISAAMQTDQIHRSPSFSGLRIARREPDFTVRSPGVREVVATVWDNRGHWTNRNLAGKRIGDAAFVRDSVSVVPPDVDWSFDLHSRGGCDFVFYIDQGKFRELFVEAMPDFCPTMIRPTVDARSPTLARAAKAYAAEFARRDRFSAIAFDSIALQVCLDIARSFTGVGAGAATASEPPTDLPGVYRAKEFILANLHEPIGLREIAEAAGLSQYYFSRMFREIEGATPYQYVREQRIRKAMQLLECSDMPIAEIAFECGFSSQQHLTTVFKGRYGVPPGQWRRLRARRH